MKYRKSRNDLDEMLDSKLLKIEETGVWLSFWGLLFAIIVQIVIGFRFREIIGELTVFAVVSVYLLFSSLKNGLWTRCYAPSIKTNVVFSIFPALLIGAISVIRTIFILHIQISLKLIVGKVILMVGTFVSCFAILEIMRRIYQNRRSKLDDIDDESEK